MSEPQTKPKDKYSGWREIAEAAGRAVQQSITPRTAQRYAQQGRDNRLPVFVYPNGRVYMIKAHLDLWAAAWLARLPLGARIPNDGKSAA